MPAVAQQAAVPARLRAGPGGRRRQASDQVLGDPRNCREGVGKGHPDLLSASMNHATAGAHEAWTCKSMCVCAESMCMLSIVDVARRGSVQPPLAARLVETLRELFQKLHRDRNRREGALAAPPSAVLLLLLLLLLSQPYHSYNT